MCYCMQESRIQHFKSLTKDQLLELNFNDFTNSEIKEILNEMQIKDDCKEIAILHHIECLSIDEVAFKMGIDRKTVIRRLKKILLHFRLTLLKLF